MRASVAIFLLAVAACVKASVAKTQGNNFSDVIACAKNYGLSKCITVYGIWRAERALQTDLDKPFNWRRLVNATDEELYTKLCDNTEKLLRSRSLKMNISDSYAIELKSSGNSKLNFDIIANTDVSTGRSTMKKMRNMFYDVLPFMILPGLVMSAVLPFFLPTLKMATLATGLLNNLALSGAIFTLLRNNAFNDKKYPKKVIYINAGYEDKFNPLAEGTSNDLVSTNYETQLAPEETHDTTHDVKDYHLIGMDPNTGMSYPFNPDWLKNNDNVENKVKNVQIIGEVPNTDWSKFKLPSLPTGWRKQSNK